MAEYIDRNLIEWYGCDFEDGSCENLECSACSRANCSHSQVMQIPTADVVEREKIDKAIEEIENINQLAQYTRGDIKRMCIEILKRNIGESREE